MAIARSRSVGLGVGSWKELCQEKLFVTCVRLVVVPLSGHFACVTRRDTRAKLLFALPLKFAPPDEPIKSDSPCQDVHDFGGYEFDAICALLLIFEVAWVSELAPIVPAEVEPLSSAGVYLSRERLADFDI
jgi:hypothetical protein